MHIRVKWFHLNVSGHANTNATRETGIRTTTFDNTAVATTTIATTRCLCGERFVCAFVAVTGGNCVIVI